MTLINVLIRSTAAAAILMSSTVCQAQMGNLRAGAAKADISPTKEILSSLGMQSFGSVHDPLYARALVLDNGSAKAVLISIDTTGIQFGSEMTQAISDELKIPAERIFLNATHTHSAPGGGMRGGPGGAAKPPYYAILLKGVMEAARQANANLQPAQVGFGTGKAYINTNRDEYIVQGYHIGYAPERPSDKTVAVMAVTKPSGEPIAIYSNYAIHALVMYRTRTDNGRTQVSSDLAGWTAQYVDEHFPGAVTLWTPGAAGDQNPIFQGNYNQDGPDVKDEGAASWAILDVQSRRLGEEIVRVTKAIQNRSSRAVLWGVKSSVTCPGQKRAEPAPQGAAPGGYEMPLASSVKMIDGDPVTIPLHLLMINDIAITGVSGEVFNEIGQHVKKESLFDRTMMVTVMPNAAGYIATDEAYRLPAEKTIGNRLKPGCAEPAMVSEFQSMMKRYLPVWQAAQ